MRYVKYSKRGKGHFVKLGGGEITVEWTREIQVRTGPKDQVTVKWGLSPARIRQAGHRK